MSKATKILNTVNKGFEKVGLTYPTYNWSKDVAVDQEMVNEIHKMDEFISIENEKLIYTAYNSLGEIFDRAMITKDFKTNNKTIQNFIEN